MTAWRAGCLPFPTPVRSRCVTYWITGLDCRIRCLCARSICPLRSRASTNIGYWLLGRVVEEITRQSFPSFVENHILLPLGITGVEIGYRYPPGVPRASGYLERYSVLNLLRPFLTAPGMAGESIGRWVRIRDHYVNGPAFGGAIGTASGFCKLARHWIENGDPGFGWGEHPGFVQKEGGGAGFHCMFRLHRTAKHASVILANATSLGVSACLDRLDQIHAQAVS